MEYTDGLSPPVSGPAGTDYCVLTPDSCVLAPILAPSLREVQSAAVRHMALTYLSERVTTRGRWRTMMVTIFRARRGPRPRKVKGLCKTETPNGKRPICLYES